MSAIGTSPEPRRLDYASPRRKIRGPLPDVVFMFGWMCLIVGMYLVISLVLGLLSGVLFA